MNPQDIYDANLERVRQDYSRSIRRRQWAWRIGTFLWVWVVVPLLILLALLGIWHRLMQEPRLYQREGMSNILLIADEGGRTYEELLSRATGKGK